MAVAIALADDGANVVVNYVTHPEAADAVVKQIEDNGGNAISIQADVSNENDVQCMFEQMISKYGTIDILVNNAGLQKDFWFGKYEFLADWQLVINVNLTGQFLCAREAVFRLFETWYDVTEKKLCLAGKNLFCMSSVHQVIPWAGHINYASSKGGIEMMMKSLAQELAPKKIRVNAIGPGAYPNCTLIKLRGVRLKHLKSFTEN